MTRGAAANAILDAGRSKKRSLSPPFALCPLARSRSLPLISFSLYCSFPLASQRGLFREPLPLFLSSSFFLLPACRFFLGVLLSPLPLSPLGLPLSSLLMPRDRQMMIKKAPVRVRTTPRRPVPTPAPRSPTTLSPSPHPPPPPSTSPPPPAILLPLFLSQFSPPHYSPSPFSWSRVLLFFCRLISARSLFPSLPPSSRCSAPRSFFLSAGLSTLRLHVCRVHHGPRRTAPNDSSAIRY